MTIIYKLKQDKLNYTYENRNIGYYKKLYKLWRNLGVFLA